MIAFSMFVEPHRDFILSSRPKEIYGFLIVCKNTDFVLKQSKRSRHDYRCSGITRLLLGPQRSRAHCSTGRKEKKFFLTRRKKEIKANG